MRVLGKKYSNSNSNSNSSNSNSNSSNTTTTNSRSKNGVDHGNGSTRNATRIRTILVWCVYGVIQCGLIRLYHHQWTLHKERNDRMLLQHHQREKVRALSKTKPNDEGNGVQTKSQSREQIGHETTTDSASSAKHTGKDSHADPPEEPPSAEKRQRPAPDGTFNGFPIYELKRKESADASGNSNNNADADVDVDVDVDANSDASASANANNANVAQSPLYSQFRCIGETWKTPVFHRRNRKWYEQSWMYRSCLFEMLCFDTEEHEYVLYLDPEKHPKRVHGYGNGSGNGNDNAGTNDHNNHPSESIRQILRKQRKQHGMNKKLANDYRNDNDNDNDNENDAASEFRDIWKHPSHWDDTSTVYRNHTTIVDATGDVVIGDVANAAQYGVAIGSLNGKWGIPDLQRLKWFPTVRWGAVPGTGGESTEIASNAADESESSHDVYTLPSSVVLLPFHSLSAANPGHLVWDDFLPAYTLLDIFHLNQKEKPHELLPIRHILPPNGKDGDTRGLWAGCDWLVDRYRACHSMLHKFGTLLGTRSSYLKYHTEEEDLAEQRKLREEEEAKHNADGTTSVNHKAEDDDYVPKGVSKFVSASKLPRIPITTNLNVQLKLNDPSKEPDPDPEPYPARDADHYQISKARKQKRRDRKRKSKQPIDKPKLVCARHGVAGFGAISDHGDGTRSHGWEQEDYKVNHNQGRGGQLWDFRNFLVGNVFGDGNDNDNGNDNGNNHYSYKTTHSPPPPITGPKPRPKIPGQPAYLTIDSVVMGMERLAEAERVANQHLQNDSTGNDGGAFSSSHTQPAYRAPSSITDWAPDEPLVVLFSAMSSRTRGRDMFSESNDLRDLIAKRGGPGRAVLGSAYDPSVPSHANLQIAIETHKYSDYNLEEQIHSTSRTAVLITFCGGGAFSSLFLPRGASLMIYYNEKGGVQNNRNTLLPARLDWDYFNNLGYLHVNWIPAQNSRFVATTVATAEEDNHKKNNTSKNTDSDSEYATNMEANADLILAHLRRIFYEREAAAAKRHGTATRE